MKVSNTFKKIIFLELAIPVALLLIGIYHGLMQSVYRAGVLNKTSFAGLDYYQGLTLHGVINAIVLTTFFGVAFGHVVMAFYFKREPDNKQMWLSFFLMLTGTVMAAWAMLAGKASVLYTFYPPLKAHPLFYLGAALLIVGSWVPMLSWTKMYLEWKREHRDTKTPLAVLGILINFTVWLVCTLAVAYEVLVLLIPWSMGWTKDVNVNLARTLFWFFGHALVYFWLLPAYIMYYTILPKIAGGKLFSDLAGRIVLFLFLIFSIPVGVHHQYSDPTITQGVKLLHGLLTYGVAIPSFITAFTIAASLEHAGRQRGGRGWFGWMPKLPWFESDKYLFAYFICGLILFIFGGITGIINASYSLNTIVHNTAWMPGHFHMTVAGPVFLAIVGMSLYLYTQMSGKKVMWPKLNTTIPYLWMIGMLIFSFGMSWGGLNGEPRRTNMGTTYLNPQSELFRSEWVPTTTVAMMGAFIMFVAGMLFIIIFFGTLLGKKKAEGTLDIPVSEAYHDEKWIPLFDRFKPWLVAMVFLILVAYVPALLNVQKYSGAKSPPYNIDNPLPAEILKKK